jgi:hypothetical protein
MATKSPSLTVPAAKSAVVRHNAIVIATTTMGMTREAENMIVGITTAKVAPKAPTAYEVERGTAVGMLAMDKI